MNTFLNVKNVANYASQLRIVLISQERIAPAETRELTEQVIGIQIAVMLDILNQARDAAIKIRLIIIQILLAFNN